MTAREMPTDPQHFVRTHTRLTPVRGVPGIVLHTAHAGSGLSRLAGRATGAPYWAFPWGGGLALAGLFRDRPQTVAGKRVLDFGAGSGIVAIAAAKAGARTVTAADIDPYAIAAVGLNAAANGIALTVVGADMSAGPPPDVDLIAAGDVFYERGFARRALRFLERCRAAGIEVLIGDPARVHLPASRLRFVAEYPVSDFGQGEGAVAGRVYSLAETVERFAQRNRRIRAYPW